MTPRVAPSSLRPPVRERLTTRVLVAAFVLALLVLGVWVLFLGAIRELRAAADLERRSSEATAAAAEVEKLAVDLETGLRGYLLTRDETFLAPTLAAQTELPSRINALEGLVNEEPRQRRLVREVNRSIGELAAYQRGLIDAGLRGDISRREAALGGKRRLDRIRRLFDEILAGERLSAGREQGRAEASARRTSVLGSGMLLGAVALFLVFAMGVARSVSRPVRRVSEGAWKLANGDFTARVPEHGHGEFRVLGRAFNSMSASLEDGRRKLNDYAVELESQQVLLERSNAELAHEKERVERLRRFGERLARETQVEPLGRLILEAMCTACGADVGTLYALDGGESRLRFAAGLGAGPEDVPASISSSDGLVGLAVGERRAIAASYGTTAPSHLGEAAEVRRELYVPLLPGDRAVGVVTLGRLGDADFSASERAALEHLADQAAVALSNVVSLQTARHQATINSAVLDATPDAVGLFDTTGATVVQNATMTAVRARIADIGPGADTERAAVDPAAYEAMLEAAGADPDRTARDEVRLGQRHLLRYTAPVRDEWGELIGRIVVLRDVTAEREADRLKEEFFALVSHELRTPLTSILGYVDLVLEPEEDEPLDPHVRRALEVVDRNAKRLLRLVGDLLFVAQFEAGTLSLEQGSVDLDDLAAEAIQAARPRAEAKGVELVLEAEPLGLCAGDHDRLAQTLDNLVSNAVKFTPTGGRVTVRVREHGDCALLEVEDTGIGIPGGEQERLFERFFRASTATASAIPGVGLGLTIVKAIVEGHGGRIAVESEEGAGTRFRILFPLRAPAGRASIEEVAR